MIRLFLLDGTEILLNVDQISQVESTPALIITLLSGEKIKIKNSEADVVTKIRAAQRGRYEESRDPNEMPVSRKPRRKYPQR